MTDIVLRDIDPVLAERIREVSHGRGMDLPQTLQWLLEQGLYVAEHGEQARLDDREADALQAAIAAMEQVPDDPGFALIGREPRLAALATPAPDQSVDTGFSLE